jgi:RNA polymerase sigma-70 factor (ECF subfamily)
VQPAQPLPQDQAEKSPATLGDVLYAGISKDTLVLESYWATLVRSIAAGDQSALHALYARTHRMVFTLIMRITSNRETAEELTLDVFHDVWRRASRYDPANGTVLGWIMNQARSRAIDRLRFDRRKRRADSGHDAGLLAIDTADYQDVFEVKERRRTLNAALEVLTPDERQAIEAAYFCELTHAEVAARFHEPLGTIKTRIRSALHKLRQALGDGGAKR